MWTLGLTGSIASGKSTVGKMFEALGVPVFSSDAAVHALYRGAAVAPIGRGRRSVRSFRALTRSSGPPAF